jgi:hypothetical protein|tara:strand:+ start:1761 stop:1934 length:174 start_codon:yes stop_codon:yes gene_type:complete
MKTEKSSIILLHATPNTHPGGDQGAWLRFVYHSVLGPSFMSQVPIPNALKFIKINIK